MMNQKCPNCGRDVDCARCGGCEEHCNCRDFDEL